jgi:hypothetical protein
MPAAVPEHAMETWPMIPLGSELRRSMNDAQKRELHRLLDACAADMDRVCHYITETTGLAVDTDDLFHRATEAMRAQREYAAVQRRRLRDIREDE